jgi:hypothetical protein
MFGYTRSNRVTDVEKDEFQRSSLVTEVDSMHTTVEVGKALRADPRTVTRWCKEGLIPEAIKTLGGHWRIPGKVFAAMREGTYNLKGKA